VSLWQTIAIVSAALAVLAGAWDAWRLRRDQRYSTVVTVITAGGPVLSLVLYILVTNLALRPYVTAVLVVIGAAAGVYAGRLAKISTVGPGGQTRLVGASWLPLPAALCVAALQVSGAANSLSGQVLSLAALEAAVSFGVASAAALTWRRAALVRAERSGPAPKPQAGPGSGPGWGTRPGA
jgi:hypothetical protein